MNNELKEYILTEAVKEWKLKNINQHHAKTAKERKEFEIYADLDLARWATLRRIIEKAGFEEEYRKLVMENQ